MLKHFEKWEHLVSEHPSEVLYSTEGWEHFFREDHFLLAWFQSSQKIAPVWIGRIEFTFNASVGTFQMAQFYWQRSLNDARSLVFASRPPHQYELLLDRGVGTALATLDP